LKKAKGGRGKGKERGGREERGYGSTITMELGENTMKGLVPLCFTPARVM